MRRDHPDKLGWHGFDHAEALVCRPIDSLKGPLALRLDVGLPDAVNLLQA